MSLGAPISATLSGAVPPCPITNTTVNLSSTGSAAGNSGVVFQADILLGPGTNNFNRTAVSSVGIGANANTIESFTLTFSQPVTNPYLFFNVIDTGETFTFTQPFSLAQASNASVSGQSVNTTGSNSQNDGFVVNVLGTYSTIDFTYNNPTGIYRSAAFSAGAIFYPEVPGPLSLMGVGMAFGFSRKLRRRIQP